MYRGLKIVVIAPCYNEASKIGEVVRRVKEAGLADEMLVVDDGSADDSAATARRAGASVLSLPKVVGVGAALRAGFLEVGEKFDAIVVIAGNNKDEPREIPRLLDPLIDEKCAFVQGSRYLLPGGCGGDMPFYRRVATRVHPWLFSLCTGRKVTESTNGFRAFLPSLLADPRIRLDQTWLDEYALEPYLYYKAVVLGYSCREVPVTKIYPPRALGYTKMRPITGWWSILKPLLWLRFGISR